MSEELDLLIDKITIAERAVEKVNPKFQTAAFEVILSRLLDSVQSFQSSKSEPDKKKGTIAPKTKSSLIAPISIDLKGDKSHPSLKDFYKQKNPHTNQEKAVLFLYYVSKNVGISPVQKGHIMYCYNEVGLRKPKSLDQLLKDIKRLKGWIQFDQLSDISLTVGGENLIEQDLPRKN